MADPTPAYPAFGYVFDMITSCSGDSNGSGLSTTDRTMPKIAALAPRQTMSVRRAVTEKVRSRDRLRRATRVSRAKSASVEATEARVMDAPGVRVRCGLLVGSEPCVSGVRPCQNESVSLLSR